MYDGAAYERTTETTVTIALNLWQLSHFDIALRLLTYIVYIIHCHSVCVTSFFFIVSTLIKLERRRLKHFAQQL